MNKAPLALQILFFIILLSVPARCHASPSTAIRFVRQDQIITEAEAYRNWYTANSAGEMKRAFELATAFLTQFPTGEHADYFRKWIPHTGIKLLEEAVTAKDVAEIDRLGKPLLAADPDIFLTSQLFLRSSYAHLIQIFSTGRTLRSLPRLQFV